MQLINCKKRSREDYNNSNSLMPPEPFPLWDRKGDLFRDRKDGYEYNNIAGNGSNGGVRGGGGGGGGRWRDRDSSSSSFATGSRNSSEFSPRWGFSSHEFRRPHGHGKQGGGHLYQEDFPHGYSTPRSGDHFPDDDSFRPSGPQGNGRNGRFYRDNRNGYSQKEYRGRSWENNQQFRGPTNTPGRPPSVNYKRSVGDSPVRPSNFSSDPTAKFFSKDQPDKTSGANGSGIIRGFGKENSLERLDWKPVKWSRSGSLTSRSYGYSHSSRSKSTEGKSSNVKDDLAPKNVTPVQSHSGDATAFSPAADPSEDTASRKKARLGWGEGLAKFEKKKVGGLEENVTKIESTASVGNVEPTHHSTSNLADENAKSTGFFDCPSPTTPSSFAYSSSPGLEEKTFGKTPDDDSNNFSVSSMPLSENQTEGPQFSLEKLELNSITNLSSLLNELLQVDEQFSTDSGSMRSSAFNKLVLWKGDISKALELTETEIDSLENELKLLKGDSSQGVLCPSLSNVLPMDDEDAHCDGLNGFTRPFPLEVLSSKDMIGRITVSSHYARGAQNESKDEDIDSPGTATSIFREGDNERDSKDYSEDNICDIILASNKETTSKASEMLTKLLPSGKTDNTVDAMEAVKLSCLSADSTIKEKFSRRKRLLKFKERVISLKYKAFHHLWKEDLHLLSLRSHRTKSHKKFDMTSRTLQIGNQKHRSSIATRFTSAAGSLSSVPSTETLNFTRKLLSDSEVKIYRSSLKMPAMILDDKDKTSSKFVSSNGLVEDPCAVEKERALINPWTIEEKEIFMEKLVNFGKDFRKIASFLDHKTIADCVQFYYKNHKSESFEKTKKLDVKKQAKPLSSDTYMLTSEKKWGRDLNSASLDLLGEASVIASQADQALKSSKLLSGKLSNNKHRGSDCVNVVRTCESLSSEPMSSCITSSVDPTDGTHERKTQKVGFSIRRPLTPDVTQNCVDDDGDDDTWSDESYGEMDCVDWTDDEKSLFVRAFLSHGKDFLVISRFVRTKTRDQCKVFFSKGRRCLGLETGDPGSCSGVVLGSNDTNGSGSDVEDACFVETCSIGCSDKSGSRIDDDLPIVSLDVSKPNSTVPDPSTSDGNPSPTQLDCKDADMEPEVLCPVNNMDPGISVAMFDSQCKESTHCGSSFANHGESVGLTGLPMDLSIETEMNDDITHNDKTGFESKVTGLPLDLSTETEMHDDISHNDKTGSESKVQSFQDNNYFRKCSRSAFQKGVADSQKIDHASSDTEKPCNSGDVKLFGKILSKPSSVDKATSSPQRYDTTANHHLTSGIVGLENVPVRNYGIWDGSKIKVVNYPQSSSAFFLAKYPDAFASRTLPSPQVVQVPVNSGECNLNNVCEFSPRDYNNGNGSFVDYPVFRGLDGMPSPYTLEFNQRQSGLPEVQRNGIEAMSSLKPQLQYAHLQFGGGGHTVNGVVREESCGGLGDVGR